MSWAGFIEEKEINMPTISRIFESNQAATQLTSITTEQFFSVEPTLDVYEGAVVQVSVNFPTSPTDNAIISVYAQQDGSNYDVVPFLQFTIDRANDPSRVTFVVKDVYKFRIGIKRSGSTDTITDADMSSRRWRWESA